MLGRRVIGLSLLFAFVFCAFAAPNATAAKKTTTAYTCVKGGGNKDFTDAHCTEKVGGGTGEYGHVEIKVDETTFIQTVGTTNHIVKSTIAGLAVEIACTGAAAKGHLTNITVKEKMTPRFTKLRTSYTGCTVPKPVGCLIKGGEIESNELEGEHLEETEAVVFKPEAGATIATITLEKCAIAGKYPLNGSVIAPIKGSILSTTEEQTTKDGTLTLGGQKAGLGGNTTIKTEKGNTSISFTTVIDP